MDTILYGSLTRIADLEQRRWKGVPLPRDRWETGDYVVGRVLPYNATNLVELPNGRRTEPYEGDLLVGALGHRRATLETVGSWRAVGSSLEMHALTSAGLFGMTTSRAATDPWNIRTTYQGHVTRDNHKVRMLDFVTELPVRELSCPVLLVVGSSMSCGKTTAARVAIRVLKKMGLTVAGTKVTGAARYRDVLTMHDGGADHILDFVDAGLPSTVCPPETYRKALHHMISRIEAARPDVLVCELGASPLEPYNGEIALEELHPNVGCILLAATDPYAVMGAMSAWDLEPDLVCGITANTEAARDLVHRLCGLEAVDVIKLESRKRLEELFASRFQKESAA